MACPSSRPSSRAPKRSVKAADTFGYPVVLKIYSETITHKTDVGGVQLNLRTPTPYVLPIN